MAGTPAASRAVRAEGDAIRGKTLHGDVEGGRRNAMGPGMRVRGAPLGRKPAHARERRAPGGR